MSTNASSDNGEHKFVITRVLNAPRQLVWRAWTESEHMKWLSPKGVEIHHAKFDFRPGGILHFCMRTPDGRAMWGKWVVREIVPAERFVFVNSFSDEAGGLARHPMSSTWPLEMLSTVTFAEQTGKTLLTIHWMPINATEQELNTFDESHESMRIAWGGALDTLAEYVEKK